MSIIFLFHCMLSNQQCNDIIALAERYEFSYRFNLRYVAKKMNEVSQFLKTVFFFFFFFFFFKFRGHSIACILFSNQNKSTNSSVKLGIHMHVCVCGYGKYQNPKINREGILIYFILSSEINAYH